LCVTEDKRVQRGRSTKEAWVVWTKEVAKIFPNLLHLIAAGEKIRGNDHPRKKEANFQRRISQDVLLLKRSVRDIRKGKGEGRRTDKKVGRRHKERGFQCKKLHIHHGLRGKTCLGLAGRKEEDFKGERGRGGECRCST